MRACVRKMEPSLVPSGAVAADAAAVASHLVGGQAEETQGRLTRQRAEEARRRGSKQGGRRLVNQDPQAREQQVEPVLPRGFHCGVGSHPAGGEPRAPTRSTALLGSVLQV